MIENVHSPLCLKLLKVSSPKTRLFIKPTGTRTCTGAEYAMSRAESSGTTSRVLWPVLPAPSPWLTWFIFPQCFTLTITRGGHHYHGPHAPLPQPGLCSSSWQSNPKVILQCPDQWQGNVSFFLWFGTLPCPFFFQIFESRLQFQCNKITNRTFVFLSSDWF